MNALKEWATVNRALESGEQTVILRKGGILEVASGFLIESKKFLLFPTYEHQTYDNLKPQYSKYLDIAMSQKPKEGQNRITSFAEVLAESDVLSDDAIKQLSEFHIWSDSYIQTRRNWMPEKPIKAVFLKTYTVPEFNIEQKPEFQGCKSWIDINANLEAKKQVLSDSDLNTKLDKFLEIVN
ncbi:MAG: DUF1802 family protein [Candidatus Nitrosotenuis sp.]